MYYLGWIILLAALSICSYLIIKGRFIKGIDIERKWILFAFILKILAGWLLILIYTYYYTNKEEADVYKYFDDGLIVKELVLNNPTDLFSALTEQGLSERGNEIISRTKYWDKSPSLPFLNDNRLIILFNAALSLISGDNIWLHSAMASLLSFIGLLYLFKSASLYLISNRYLFFALLFISPSMLLWTSSVLKEAFMIFSVGGFIYFLHKKGFRALLLACLFGILLLSSKLYLLAAIIPAILSFIWQMGKTDKKIWLRYLSVNFLLLSIVLNLNSLNPEYDVLRMISNKQYEFKCLAEWTGAGSTVHLPDLNEHINSYLKAFPFALYNVLFRPTPWDLNNFFSIVAFGENLLIVLLIISAFLFTNKTEGNGIKNLLLFNSNIVFLLVLIIGLTTPVLGAIVRYKVAYYPFLFFAICLFLDFNKMIKFVGLKRNT